MREKIIGLFGTCGKSKWRDHFIRTYETDTISYFNPVKKDWKPEDAVNEANHMANDEIIVIAILGETFSTASLAEVGFAVINTLLDQSKYAIIYLEKEVTAELKDSNPQAAKESNNARKIVWQHLLKVTEATDRIYLAESLEDARNKSLEYYNEYYSPQTKKIEVKEEVVEITKNRHQELLQSETTLDKLIGAGVDNWQGYYEALFGE